jgi:DNA-binding transcriptional LysR family regulator
MLEPRVAADLADGRLIALLQEHTPPFAGFFLYHPSRRQMRPALRAFIDFFVAKNLRG